MRSSSLKWGMAVFALNMVFGSVAYSATFEPTSLFSDISQIPQDKTEAIREAVRLGLLSGYPNGEFHPLAQLTRQELAVILAKALHLQIKSSVSSSFKDVDSINWASGYIEAVKGADLMSGDKTNIFRPNDPVSREELATIFVRAIGGTEALGGQVSQVADQSQISVWASGSVDTALRLGLIDTPDGRLNPKGALLREDIALFLVEIFKQEQQTAKIDRVDGDIVTIDGVPYLVAGKLKQIIGDTNREALVGAVLKFNSLNRNLDGIQELEIVQSGVVINASSISANTSLRISGDNVTLRGNVPGELIVKEGVSSLNIEGRVERIILNTVAQFSLKGTGSLQNMQIVSAGAKVTLDPSLAVENLQLPANTQVSQVIQNYQAVQKSITHVLSADGIIQTPSVPGSSNQSDGNSPVNHAPYVRNTIDTVTVGFADGTHTVSLASTFSDPDNDALTYTAASANTDAVTVSINGADLTITPVHAGTAIITVTANDGKGGSKQTTFTVTVEAATPVNREPIVVNTISSFTASVENGSRTVSLASTFSDPDNDALTYTAASANTGIATVSINGADLTITPVHAGTAIITVTANDGKGGSKQTTFTVTFEAATPVNREPIVVNTISSFTASVENGSRTVSLTSTFSDPDNDALIYTAASANTDAATVSINGADLTITPVHAGTAIITVTANDGKGGSKQTTFTVTFEAAVPKGLFFSELVWGQSDSNLQAIELYNPTGHDIDTSKIRIERSNGGEPITLENGKISSGGLFMIVESSYSETDVPVDYNTMMNFYYDDTQPVTLSLYYENKLMDIVVFCPYQSVSRVSGTVIGSTTAYESAQWVSEGVDYIGGLGKYTP
ncbi:hypothetical protein Back11_49630 [Paenibacillus baekrokdamisoli]|uniref:Uncharacterized protein n=1 Tax=Paenibacillus baekrokdamisoli TaxID=1712516 RepID=A0A3G9JHU2_9BACL|nr:S-layer homology domain-containing protein [Paenibacillus baekrokdamisoli]MBB3068791.1 uncharacterized protein YjdB [Paenibacillus baekrokdamisoli]BBH23618.1 hypothetical protein Back11_49630 [Paenibacillus baekrokdamisoli]